jgi:carotenoid 1,2-hydratase
VFSPYYFRANRKGAPAENHIAFNAALYNPNRWAMTERTSKHLSRGQDFLQIGPSALRWDGTALTAEINEITVPVPRRLRGTVRLVPSRIESETYNLDDAGRHRWRPIAPRARINVDFEKPALRWEGQAYFDSNHGDVPLAEDFSTWHWSRADSANGATVFYDTQHRDGGSRNLALRFGPDGVTHFTPPPLADLPHNAWSVVRHTRADTGFTPRVVKNFESAPFYSREKIATSIAGENLIAVHESLDLRRFEKPWVRTLLPFRMPRRIF